MKRRIAKLRRELSAEGTGKRLRAGARSQGSGIAYLSMREKRVTEACEAKISV